MSRKYSVEFILSTGGVCANAKLIYDSLVEFAEKIVITHFKATRLQGESVKLQLETQEPEIIFDICAQFGAIKSVKVSEQGGAPWQKY